MRTLTISILAGSIVGCSSANTKNSEVRAPAAAAASSESPNGAFSSRGNRKINIVTLDGEKFAREYRGADVGREYVPDLCVEPGVVQYLFRVNGVQADVSASYDTNGKPTKAVVGYVPDNGTSPFISLEWGEGSAFAPPTKQRHAEFKYSKNYWGKIDSIKFDESGAKFGRDDIQGGLPPIVELFREAARYVPTFALYCVRKGS